MKIQIRKNVFETNSSSMHSLVICNEEKLNQLYVNGESRIKTHDDMLEELERYLKNGVLDYSYSSWQFGRSPFRFLSTFSDKLQYYLASNVGWDEDKIPTEIMEVVQKLLPEVKKIKLPKPDRFGNRPINFDESYYYSWKHKYNFTDEEFLTDDKYIVIQDGDEYCKWLKLYRIGIIDKDFIDSDTEYNPTDDFFSED